MNDSITWADWKCVRQIGAGSYGKVYEIEKIENGKSYKAALKVITIPQNEADVENVYSEGMTDEEVTSYYRSIVDDFTKEIAVMSELKGFTNIVSYDDHKVLRYGDRIGWDILIKMELLTPLLEWEKQHFMEEQDIIQLGCDMCSALELCHKNSIIHRDIKPQNIFVNKHGNFKLGDFGIARVVDRTNTVLSAKGTYAYMAPEVYKEMKYDKTADIYSLGLVLYRYLNNNRTPFLPMGSMNYNDRDSARDRRMSGEAIPAPMNGSDKLKLVVLTALQYDPKKRFHSAEEFKKALEMCLSKQADYELSEICDVHLENEQPKEEPPVQKVPRDSKKEENPDEEKTAFVATSKIPPKKTKKNSHKMIDWARIAVLGGIIVVGILIIGILTKIEPEADIAKQPDKSGQEQSEETEKTPEFWKNEKLEEVVAENNDIETEEDTQTEENQLVCDITTVADYSENLDSAEYSFYQSELMRDFNFYYPPSLYNRVEVNQNVKGNPYGTILEKISFTGSDNESTADYQLIRRETGRTRVEDTQRLYDSYKQNMIGFQKVIFHDGADERPGRMIVIGYKDSSQTIMTYLLAQVTDEYIMSMEIAFPTDGNRETEDFWQKEYVVECMYRLCGFSGSSKVPQTYQEFFDAKQEAVMRNVSDSMVAIKIDLRKYQNMTYSQYKEMTGADVGYWRDNVFGGDIPNTNLSIAFRASYFNMDDWYQLQDYDLCYRLEGTLGTLLDGIVGEMTIEDLQNALSQGTVAAKTEYGQGYAGVQTLSESWAVITFDSNQDGQYDAEVHADISRKNTVDSETLAWAVLDLRDNNSEVLGWDE